MENCRILAKGEFVSNDTWKTGLNNNDLIVGPTGSGKTRYYVKPNLMQASESVVVADTKGTLVREVGPMLERRGYDVVHIDFTDPAAGIGYNPLDYVQMDERTGRVSERDIMRIAESLCPVESHSDPFWDHAAKALLACLIGYVMEFACEEERTLGSVLLLQSGLGAGETELLMDDVVQGHPESFTARKWASIATYREADKMYASVIGVASEKLDQLTFGDTEAMFRKKDRVDLASIGLEKTAVFLTVSDTDRSMDRLVSLFYAQALQVLCELADGRPSGALPMPVRLYLDDFATNCRIADFDKVISVIRSRNIAVSVILQSITQLETLYTHAEAMTIVNGCDHLVYLGGQDVETARFVSIKANKTVDTVLHQALGTIWLFERGKRGKTVQRYELKDHERYCELSESFGVGDGAPVAQSALSLGNDCAQPV